MLPSFFSILPAGAAQVLVMATLVLLGFFVGYFLQVKKSQVKSLIREAKLRAAQIKALEDINRDLEATTRSLSAKEFELSNANQRLRELEDAKTKFVSVTTHQLRTPLAAIKWTFFMLLNKQLGEISPDQQEFLQKGLTSTERMIKIVNELLSINLQDNNGDAYQFEAVSLDTLIKNILGEFYSPAQSKQISLFFKPSSSNLPPVRADQGKLRMVLENLIDNAIKYTGQGGQVTVTLDDSDLNSSQPKLEVLIRDSGIGLSPEAKQKVFQKFYRAPEAVAVEPDGSGLGLYIAKDIIEKHGGTIWFESNDGVGTVFHFTLPLFQK